MKNLFYFIIIYFLYLLNASAQHNLTYSSKFIVGGLLGSKESVDFLQNTIKNFYIGPERNRILIEFKAELLELNDLSSINQLCSLIKDSNSTLIAMIIGSQIGASEIPSLSTSLTCSFYDIPLISISARHSTFTDKYTHKYFLRTVPPYSRETNVWIELIKDFKWLEVSIILQDDHETIATLTDFLLVEHPNFRIKKTHKIKINYPPDIIETTIADTLSQISNKETRVILLNVRKEYAERIFEIAKEMGLLNKGWVWVVSEQVLSASNIPQGAIGLRLPALKEEFHLADAVKVIKNAIETTFFDERFNDKIDNLKSINSCDSDILSISNDWKNISSALYQNMKRVTLDKTHTSTGEISFDENGNRAFPFYEIINVQDKNGSPQLVKVGEYSFSSNKNSQPLKIALNEIIWPGYTEPLISPPKSFKKKTNLNIVTLLSKPFVEARLLESNHTCNVSTDPNKLKYEVPCTLHNGITDVEYCCYGYCIDLLRRLSLQDPSPVLRPSNIDKAMPTNSNYSERFSYKLYLQHENLIGERKMIKEGGNHLWTGIIGELISGKADLAVAPMSITRERANNLDFTKPFKYLGNTILVKRESLKSNLASFLQPFENTLWVLVGLSVHIVALVLYLLDRFSPFSRFKLSKNPRNCNCSATTTGQGQMDNLTKLTYEELQANGLLPINHVPHDKQRFFKSDGAFHHPEKIQICPVHSLGYQHFESQTYHEDALSLPSAMWFAWGVLLNSGIGEGTPRSFSARIMGMVWAGFSMIIVASYTANLAAFLVLDRPKAFISGIDDAKLRNPHKDFIFATVRASPVEGYFKRQIEYTTMYRTMQDNNYPNADEAIKAVKNETLKAFIWDSARLSYEASADCDLMTAGEVFGRNDYGVAMVKGNPWLAELSQAILLYHERGDMERLDSEWILKKDSPCDKTESSPATLGLANMAGVFIMVAAGIIVGVFLIFIEIAYKKHRAVKIKQLEIARAATNRWRNTVERRKIMRTLTSDKRRQNNSLATDFIGPFKNICQSTSNLTVTSNQIRLRKQIQPSICSNKMLDGFQACRPCASPSLFKLIANRKQKGSRETFATLYSEQDPYSIECLDAFSANQSSISGDNTHWEEVTITSENEKPGKNCTKGGIIFKSPTFKNYQADGFNLKTLGQNLNSGQCSSSSCNCDCDASEGSKQTNSSC